MSSIKASPWPCLVAPTAYVWSIMGSKKANTKKKKGKEKDNSPPGHDKGISDRGISCVPAGPRLATDSRFNGMFTHNSSSAPVDNPTNSTLRSPRHYYYKEDRENVEHSNSSSDKNEDKEEEEEEEGLMEVNCAKPENVKSEETSESKSAMDKDSDTDVKSEIEKQTHRLAVVNLDWRRVKAIDLYKLFFSFVPPFGLVHRVAVYPTEFGLQRMREENEKSDGHLIDDEKLCAYEKSMMRYYHAVVDCDSTTTADYVYKKCNGVEFFHPPNLLDLRFIPDTMEFKHPPRDVADLKDRLSDRIAEKKDKISELVRKMGEKMRARKNKYYSSGYSSGSLSP